MNPLFCLTPYDLVNGSTPYQYPAGPTEKMSTSGAAARKKVNFAKVQAQADADVARTKRRGGKQTSGGTRYIAGRKNGNAGGKSVRGNKI